VRREGLVEPGDQGPRGRGRAHLERLRCEPTRAGARPRCSPLDELPDIEKAEHRLERLVHERETMGAVNLRAEEEAQELEQQITGMTAERDDLIAAIGRLRQGISSLNREGRERFVVAFEQVSGHFQQLFTKLFGGGKAELRLTESEDPLEAGLEIHASPPGKKLQVMSLLSGGEQALTALSLLFAVFMTNPAPICVLDEVDAPLDDVNVERFCALVQEIAGRTDTRFLIITHHRVTMARMTACTASPWPSRACRSSSRSTCRRPIAWWRSSTSNKTESSSLSSTWSVGLNAGRRSSLLGSPV
jgi:chromosome segregation protein